MSGDPFRQAREESRAILEAAMIAFASPILLAWLAVEWMRKR